eukprot:11846089-Prorocentrum_lima.AAC.1
MLLPILPFPWTTASSSPDLSFLLLVQDVTTTVDPMCSPRGDLQSRLDNPLFKVLRITAGLS